MWVNEYGSIMCCELCCDQIFHDHGERSPAGHHQPLPSVERTVAAMAIVTKIDANAAGCFERSVIIDGLRFG